jgi:peptidoglycan-N-acetylglucosamine deacetylase
VAEWVGGAVQQSWLAAALAGRSRRVLFAAPTALPQVALTFDDAPHGELTPALLDVLDRHGAPATFFCLGARAAERPDLVGELVRRGHEVGNHLWADRPSVRQSPEEFRRDLLRTHDVLVAAGARPEFLRPGSGWVRPSMLRTVEEEGYRLALGSIAVLDLAVRDLDEQERFVARRLRPGAVVVLHEGSADRARVVALTDRILGVLARRGLRPVGLSALHGSAEGAG